VSKPLSPQVAALADQGIRWVAITWVNHAGAPLVKVVPLASFDAAAAVGVGFSPVSDAFRADGAIDPAHGLARPDGDLRLRADAAALALLEPGSGWAWAPGDRFERSGEPYAGDQRHRCRQQQEQLLLAGVELRAGFELEWLVASHRPDADPQPAMPGGPYGADRLVEGLDYATALLDGLEAAGIPWLQFHPEYGAGQFELSLAPGTPLEAADRLVHARLVIQRVTRRFGGHFGWRCSFSPKPSLERVGNGGHLHLSLRRDGLPLLQGGDGPGGLSAAGGAVLAALLEELPGLLALACPLEISYRRLAPGSWSAPFQVWGIENREAALRLIPTAADGAAAHLELKVVDLAANPYLLLAAVQAVALVGLDQARPVSGDPAHLPAGAAVRLPASLAEASAAFAASALLRQAFGEDLHASLLDSQAAEVRRCAGLSDVALAAADAWWPLVGGVG
jgi:glutamine synthetase